MADRDPQPPTPTLGQRLAAARNHTGLSQGDAAEQAGMHKRQITAVESDAIRISWRAIWKLARVYGCDPQSLDPHLRSVSDWSEWKEEDPTLV